MVQNNQKPNEKFLITAIDSLIITDKESGVVIIEKSFDNKEKK